jgi:hypothetical protein
MLEVVKKFTLFLEMLEEISTSFFLKDFFFLGE